MEKNKDIQGEEISEPINEEQLDGVAGGWSENRYDPKTCKNMTERKDACIGFIGLRWCDHYREERTGGRSSEAKKRSCTKGAFPPYIK